MGGGGVFMEEDESEDRLDIGGAVGRAGVLLFCVVEPRAKNSSSQLKNTCLSS